MSAALFISYAREDVAAAVKLAQSLREAGLEVWLDQDELRGGDAWDAKIKRQIRECTLFLALISQRTQLRREGYFRLEWLLAEQRSQLMARGTPFLVPVAIDDVAESKALVPDCFLAVQWTRLPGGECPPGFATRITTLLSGGTEPPFAAAPRPARPAPAATKRRLAVPLIAAAVTALVAGGLLLWHPWQRPAPPPVPPAGGAPVSRPTATNADFPRDPDLKKAMDLIARNDAIPEDFSLAEELVQQQLTQHPTDADATVVMAMVQDAFIYRGFDQGPARLASAQRYAERAVLLAPDNAYAQGALGIYIFKAQQVDRCLAVLAKAIALKPDEPLFYRFRDDCLFFDERVTSIQAVASAEATAARFPRDALSHYELARHYRDLGRIGDMERELDRAIAISPIANALVWKARVALWVRGDPDEMRRLLDQVPGRGHSLDRWTIGTWIYSLVTGKTEVGIQALQALPQDWIVDFDYIGPKQLLAGILLDQTGKRDLAKVCYTAALNQIDTHKAKDPTEDGLVEAELWCLHGLGRDGEAQGLLRASNQAQPRPYRFGFGRSWWFASIPTNLILGERATALEFLREAVTRQMEDTVGHVVSHAESTEVTRSGYPTDYRHILAEFMQVDPRMAPFREDPEIKALLAPAAGEKR